MPPPTRYASSGELKIAYQVNGDGQVDVVLAPGTASHLDIGWEWPAARRFYEAMGSFCRLIRFDKRGTGLSDRPVNVATLEERIDDIRAVMDAAGSKEAVIFGASEGGSMACLFAATYPDRTRGLIVWGCQARWIQSADYPWGESREEFDRAMVSLQENGITLEYLTGHGAGLGQKVDAAFLDWFLRYARAGASPGAVVALERMNAEIDIRDILPSIRVPALVMNREGDPIASVEAARDLARAIPNARFATFPGATHNMYAIEPERVLAQLEEFITGVRRAPTAERVLASLVMCDIVGSTERAASIGDADWRDLLARFHGLAALDIDSYGGHLVDTAGDSLLATFDGPARAIRCAFAIEARGRELGLSVRAGVHTGEVERDGAAIRGIAVHIAARVAALAAQDEVMVTSTVRDLVAGSELRFTDAGLHELKGVPEARHLYRVVA